MPDTNNLRVGKIYWFQRYQFIIAGRAWKSSLHKWLPESIAKGIQEGVRARHSPQGHTPYDILPPTRPYLLFFSTYR
jgi:hypothetical protein